MSKRSAMCVAVVNELLYVCGGYDGASSMATVEMYNPSEDRWTFAAPMNRPRSAAGVAVIENYIYGRFC